HQDAFGRALVGLRAIELSADALRGYRAVVYAAHPDVKLAAELAALSTGIPIETIPHVPHREMLGLHGQARMSIAMSIGDGMSAATLEAMAMGSFPISSTAGCLEDWIQPGEN